MCRPVQSRTAEQFTIIAACNRHSGLHFLGGQKSSNKATWVVVGLHMLFECTGLGAVECDRDVTFLA